jgi:hypothetical protein
MPCKEAFGCKGFSNWVFLKLGFVHMNGLKAHRSHLLGAKTWQKLLEALKKPPIVSLRSHSCPREKFYKIWYIVCLHYWNCVRKNLSTNVRGLPL